MTRRVDSFSHAVDLARHHGIASMTFCPAHDDSNPSLDVRPGTDQPVVFICRSHGCDYRDILHAANLELDQVCNPLELRPRVIEHVPQGKVIGRFTYCRADGTPLAQHLRLIRPDGSRGFTQRQIVDGKWVYRGHEEAKRVPYRLPELIKAVEAGETVYVCEGERDVDALVALGLAATTNANGATHWTDEHSRWLADASVVIIADADTAGRKHARAVQKSLAKVNASVVVKEPMGGCKDLVEHLVAGGTVDTLLTTRDDATWSVTETALNFDQACDYPPEITQPVFRNTLHARERLILTGGEGIGKATLMRQFAVCAMSGIHPFTLVDGLPCKALYIDGQDGKDQQATEWAKLRRTLRKMGRKWNPDLLQVETVDRMAPVLTTNEGREWLFERISAHRPALVLFGPMRNFVSGKLGEEEVAQRLTRTIDAARHICDSAFVIEHHAPHGQAQRGVEREWRPYGSQLLMAWPEFGLGIGPLDEASGTCALGRWRGLRNRSRYWPTHLRKGAPGSLEFPWVAHEDVEGSVNVKARLHTV